MTDAPARPGFGPPRWEGDTRPPFTAGNGAALVHGAWSKRRISPLASELLDDALAQAAADPDLAHLRTPLFRPALRAWARTEARVELVAVWLDDRTSDATPGDLTGEGEVRPAADLLTRLEGQALKHRAALGLDPASMARLRRDAGSARAHFDLAALIAAVGDEKPDTDTDTDEDHHAET